jgi:glycerol kinase
MLALFDVPRALLPTVLDCAADFGQVTPDILGRPCRSAAWPATSRRR